MNEEQFGSMHYAEFVFQAEMFAEEKAEHFKSQMIVASFSVWQANPGKQSFNEYLSVLGLADKSVRLSASHKKMLIERGESIAERIKKADQMRLKNEKII